MRSTFGPAAIAAIGAAVLLPAVLPAASAHTSSATVPATKIVYNKIVTNGAPVYSIAHTTSADGSTITQSDVSLVGTYSNNAVKARFDNGPTTTCRKDSKDKRGELDVTHFRCSGLTQPIGASSTLTLQVS